MLLIIGSRHHPDIGHLVKRWRKHGAHLLSCEDMLLPGWTWTLTGSGTAIVEGRAVAMKRISHILTLRPQIYPRELPQMEEIHREYSAQELAAFLQAWIWTMRDKTLNPPSQAMLAGPSWSAMAWRQAAREAGFILAPTPARQISLDAAPLPAAAPRTTQRFAFLDGTLIGPVAKPLPAAFRHAARRLAARAHVRFLTVTCLADTHQIVTADAWPDPANAWEMDAILHQAFLTRGRP